MEEDELLVHLQLLVFVFAGDGIVVLSEIEM